MNLNQGYKMNENEIKEFLNQVLPMLKELSKEEIIENIKGTSKN